MQRQSTSLSHQLYLFHRRARVDPFGLPSPNLVVITFRRPYITFSLWAYRQRDPYRSSNPCTDGPSLKPTVYSLHSCGTVEIVRESTYDDDDGGGGGRGGVGCGDREMGFGEEVGRE
jgi:hypothetical protein